MHYNYHYNYNYNYMSTTITTTLRCLQPLVGPSVSSLCHPSFTATNLSYRFPILKLPPPPCAVLAGINITTWPPQVCSWNIWISDVFLSEIINASELPHGNHGSQLHSSPARRGHEDWDGGWGVRVGTPIWGWKLASPRQTSVVSMAINQ